MKTSTALLIIDVQQGFFDETDKEDDAFLKRIAGVLERAREQQIPLLRIRLTQSAFSQQQSFGSRGGKENLLEAF